MLHSKKRQARSRAELRDPGTLVKPGRCRSRVSYQDTLDPSGSNQKKRPMPDQREDPTIQGPKPESRQCNLQATRPCPEHKPKTVVPGPEAETVQCLDCKDPIQWHDLR
jgi:hypothetical protein